MKELLPNKVSNLDKEFPGVRDAYQEIADALKRDERKLDHIISCIEELTRLPDTFIRNTFTGRRTAQLRRAANLCRRAQKAVDALPNDVKWCVLAGGATHNDLNVLGRLVRHLDNVSIEDDGMNLFRETVSDLLTYLRGWTGSTHARAIAVLLNAHLDKAHPEQGEHGYDEAKLNLMLHRSNRKR